MEENNNKIVLKNQKKITVLEISIVLMLIATIALYMMPKMTLSKEKRQNAIVQTNAAIMTSKILAEYANKANKSNATQISNSLSEELNKTIKNPVKKENPAYSVGKECLGCVVLNPNDKVNNITIIGHDKGKTLLVRTIVQPPSFVTFVKDLDEKEAKRDEKGAK